MVRVAAGFAAAMKKVSTTVTVSNGWPVRDVVVAMTGRSLEMPVRLTESGLKAIGVGELVDVGGQQAIELVDVAGGRWGFAL